MNPMYKLRITTKDLKFLTSCGIYKYHSERLDFSKLILRTKKYLRFYLVVVFL